MSARYQKAVSHLPSLVRIPSPINPCFSLSFSLSPYTSLVVSRISGKLCWKAAGGTREGERVGLTDTVHPIQSFSRGNRFSPLQPSLFLCVSMNAVNKKVSSHLQIRRPALRRNQDGGLLRKSFSEHLRIPERQPPTKEKYLLGKKFAAQRGRLICVPRPARTFAYHLTKLSCETRLVESREKKKITLRLLEN